LAAVLGIAVATAAAARADDKVSIIMSWLADPQHGGYYQAQATGIYKKYGLDVTIRPGGPQVNSGQLIAAGAVDFRVGSNSGSGLNYVREGVPAIVIAASFQKDPQVIIAHPGVGNDNLAALKGKPIMIGQQSVDTWWPFLKARFGYTDDQIRPYTFNLTTFLVDKNAIQQGYVTAEPYLIKQQGGFTPNVFLLADAAGYDAYSQTLEATAAMVKTKPDVVQRFVNATIEGWYSYLYGDPAPGNAAIKAANPDAGDDIIAYSLAVMKDRGIVDSGDTKTLGIGAMTDARWRSFFETAAKVGLYPATLDYKQAYTLQFINKAVGLRAAK
jgi:NitT/TauT family transport system substrate-binding protein